MPYGAPSSPVIRARRLLLVMPVTAHRVTHRAPARAWTRESPNRMAVALRPSAVTVGCAIRSKTGFARTQPWPTRSACNTRALTARRLGLQIVEIVQAALAAQVVGGVDHGLDSERPAVLQVLLDAGVLVEGVHRDLGAAGDDFGLELAPGGALAAADLAVEDDLDGVRAAKIEVVGDECLEKPRA